jgi:hypothetical protein
LPRVCAKDVVVGAIIATPARSKRLANVLRATIFMMRVSCPLAPKLLHSG